VPARTVPSGAVDFRTESVVRLARRVREGEVSASEVVGHALAQIEVLNPVINAFVAVDGDRARAAAAAVDDRIDSGADPGPLAGIPIGVKDLDDAAGFVTTHGSRAFANDPPKKANSALVARLVAAGCVVVGKTNTPELGWKADTDNTVFGATANPWNLDHTAGGSSGGSAAAIAAGMVPLATGSDGGGSIRIPSSCCGLSGMKPSLGRVPSGGDAPPDWQHLSTKGPMARRLSDVVAALDIVVGPDPSDLRSLPRPEASWLAVLEDPRPPRRVAWSPTLGYAEVDDEVLAICTRAVDVMASLGAEIVEVDSVFEKDPVDDWLVLSGAYNLRTHDAIRGTSVWEDVDPMLKMVIDGAAATSALDLVRAEDVCHLLNLRLIELFRSVRLLITPTVAAPPPPRSLGGSALINGKEDFNWVKMTYPFNMTRSPAATVCAGTTSLGLPVGVQLVGPQHGDLVVLRSAAALEQALGFDELAPFPDERAASSGRSGG
jgi:aspartyl-tRNA(Asn)/glutamyl-tRNA(Gln) amidotransferase subunit A